MYNFHHFSFGKNRIDFLRGIVRFYNPTQHQNTKMTSFSHLPKSTPMPLQPPAPVISNTSRERFTRGGHLARPLLRS